MQPAILLTNISIYLRAHKRVSAALVIALLFGLAIVFIAPTSDFKVQVGLSWVAQFVWQELVAFNDGSDILHREDGMHSGWDCRGVW
jgi:hypothetical protein